MTPSLRKYLTATTDQWLPDLLPHRADALHNMLNQPSVPTVYYLHCDCGCDRTGEVIGAYELTHMGMSMKQVQTLNTQIANRPMMCDQFLALQVNTVLSICRFVVVVGFYI